MDRMKVMSLSKRFEGKDFPSFKPLNQFENIRLYRDLVSKTGLKGDIDPYELVDHLYKNGKLCTNTNAKDKNFNLAAFINSQHIFPQENIYVSWGNLSHTDLIKFEDLSKSFKDIWYPGKDDVILFDNTFNWFLFIDHDGSVFLNKSSSDVHNLPT